MVPTTLLQLAQPDFSGVGGAVLAVFGVLVVLAVLVKGVCFVLHMTRAGGGCRSGGMGVPTEKEPGQASPKQRATRRKKRLC